MKTGRAFHSANTRRVPKLPDGCAARFICKHFRRDLVCPVGRVAR